MDGLVGRNISKSTLTCSKYRKHMHQFNSIWNTSKLQYMMVKWGMLYDIKFMCFQDFQVYAIVQPFHATIHCKSFLKHTTCCAHQSGNTWFYSTHLKLFAPEPIKHVNICCETLSFSLALASFYPGIVCVHMQKKTAKTQCQGHAELMMQETLVWATSPPQWTHHGQIVTCRSSYRIRGPTNAVIFHAAASEA